MIFICDVGHGGPAAVGNTYLEGTYNEFYPDISQDAEGMKKLFTRFSFPGGIPSPAAPETPGSIHEGGELGYAVSQAYGATFDNPDLIVACLVGDGGAETGALATAWHSDRFLNPIHEGAVLSILHLNGYKIANPTILARISHEELKSLFIGSGYKSYFVEGSEPEAMHQLMAEAVDTVIAEIVADVIDRVPKLAYVAAYAKQAVRDKLIEHKEYIAKYGQDMPEIREWTWKCTDE
jgi:xylulose-5-phosphate/fructose-6-phosphate phosphoketolase